jgi:PDZ domain-containing secreted protein
MATEGAGAERIKPLRPLFRKLFLETTGLVDFCAAQEGRAGYSYTRKKTEIHSGRKFVMNDPGSAMTFALTDAMKAYKGRTMDWASLFVIVQDQTRKNANTNTMGLVKRDLRDIGKEDLIKDAKEVSQYPLAFSLGNRAAAARGSGIKVLGMNVETRQEGGVAVSKVIPKTAATKAGFEVKDVITKVNGKTVNSKEEFDAAVADSGTVVNFTVIDQRTNKETIFPMSIYLPSE